jgi:protein TonB
MGRKAGQELWRRGGVQRSEAAQPSEPIPKLREAAAWRLILRKASTATDAAANFSIASELGGHRGPPLRNTFRRQRAALRGGRGAEMSGENILKGCLVESDPTVIARERQAKRRALVVAIILQVLLVGLLVLAPLLGAVEKLPWTTREITPMPPYKGGPKESVPKRNQTAPSKKPPLIRNERPIFQPTRIPANVAEINDPPEIIAEWKESNREGENRGGREGINIDWFDSGERRAVVPKAPEMKPQPKPRPVVSEGVQAARLVRRVEPKYPVLPLQARMEGKVVLRAVIAKDGTIQSLEVMSGSPLFVDAAREAIAQWRYQPTLLNGVPVEVETVITVVFAFKR